MKIETAVFLSFLTGLAFAFPPSTQAEKMLAVAKGESCLFFPESRYELKPAGRGIIYPKQAILEHQRARESKRMDNNTLSPHPNEILGYKLEEGQTLLRVAVEPGVGNQRIVWSKKEVELYLGSLRVESAQAIAEADYAKSATKPPVVCSYSALEASAGEAEFIAQVQSKIENWKPRFASEKEEAAKALQFYGARQAQVAALRQDLEGLDFAKSKRFFEGAGVKDEIAVQSGDYRPGGPSAKPLDAGSGKSRQTAQAISKELGDSAPDRPGAAPAEASTGTSSPSSNAAKKGAAAAGAFGGLAAILYGWFRKYKAEEKAAEAPKTEEPPKQEAQKEVPPKDDITTVQGAKGILQQRRDAANDLLHLDD